MKWCASSLSGMSISIEAKVMLEELDEGGSGKTSELTDAPSSDGVNGDNGGGGKRVDGGAAINGGKLIRDEDAFRTRTNGRIEPGGLCAVLTVDNEERALLNMTGEGDEADAGDWLRLN